MMRSPTAKARQKQDESTRRWHAHCAWNGVPWSAVEGLVPQIGWSDRQDAERHGRPKLGWKLLEWEQETNSDRTGSKKADQQRRDKHHQKCQLPHLWPEDQGQGCGLPSHKAPFVPSDSRWRVSSCGVERASAWQTTLATQNISLTSCKHKNTKSHP
jgi:hypothetical protein